MTTTTQAPPRPLQLRLVLVALPGPDWADQEPYASERKGGRLRSCPAQIVVDGRVLRYAGGLIEGEPRYE